MPPRNGVQLEKTKEHHIDHCFSVHLIPIYSGLSHTRHESHPGGEAGRVANSKLDAIGKHVAVLGSAIAEQEAQLSAANNTLATHVKASAFSLSLCTSLLPACLPTCLFPPRPSLAGREGPGNLGRLHFHEWVQATSPASLQRANAHGACSHVRRSWRNSF